MALSDTTVSDCPRDACISLYVLIVQMLFALVTVQTHRVDVALLNFISSDNGRENNWISDMCLQFDTKEQKARPDKV